MRPATVFGIFTNLVPRVCVTFNPLIPKGDQRQISPCNITAL